MWFVICARITHAHSPGVEACEVELEACGPFGPRPATQQARSTRCPDHRTTAEDEAAVARRHSQLEPRLYLADPATIVDVVRRSDADARRLMVVGHNPGLEELVARLTGVTEPLPTATLVQIQLPIEQWKELRLSTGGQLVNAWQARTLD